MSEKPKTFGGMTREEITNPNRRDVPGVVADALFRALDARDAEIAKLRSTLTEAKCDYDTILGARDAKIARLNERIEDERRIRAPWCRDWDNLEAKAASQAATIAEQKAELAALRTVAEAAMEYEYVRGDDAFQELHYALAAWRAALKGGGV